MPYAAFEICTVTVGDDKQSRRGAKIVCGHCHTTATAAVNTMVNHGDDDDIIERNVTRKFEQHGWKVGKTASQHRCPKCFNSAKNSVKHKVQQMDNKVVPMTSTAITTQTVELPRGERPMSRDERRLIIERMMEVYVNETVGYKEDWSDEKVSKDMGVPRVWVAQVRDETFGPDDTNEQSGKLFEQAKDLMVQLKAVKLNMEPFIQQITRLMAKYDVIQQELHKLTKGR